MLKVLSAIIFMCGCFWIFGSYQLHCSFLSKIGFRSCLPYMFHILIGIVLIGISIFLYHHKYILNTIKNILPLLLKVD